MNILIVGLGSIGIRHLINFHTLNPRANFFALRQNLAPRMTKHPNFNQLLPNYTTLNQYQDAKAIKPDIVIVSNPSALHCDTALFFHRETDAIILLEKPCATSLESLAQFGQIPDPHRVLVAQQLRFHPLTTLIKKINDSSVLGSLYRFKFVHAEHIDLWHPWENFRASYAVRQDLGGGSFLTQNHGTDLMFYLFGAPDHYVTMTGNGSHLGIDCDEMFISSLRYDQPRCNLLGTIECDYLGRPPRMTAEFNFSRGSVKLDFRSGEIEALIGRKNGQKKIGRSISFERNTQYLDMARAVYDCVGSASSTPKDHRLVDIREAIVTLERGLLSITNII